MTGSKVTQLGGTLGAAEVEAVIPSPRARGVVELVVGVVRVMVEVDVSMLLEEGIGSLGEEAADSSSSSSVSVSVSVSDSPVATSSPSATVDAPSTGADCCLSAAKLCVSLERRRGRVRRRRSVKELEWGLDAGTARESALDEAGGGAGEEEPARGKLGSARLLAVRRRAWIGGGETGRDEASSEEGDSRFGTASSDSAERRECVEKGEAVCKILLSAPAN